MRDFNFFNELDSGKKKKTSFSTYIIGVFLLLFLVLGLTSYYYMNLVSQLESDKTVMENQLNDSAHQAAYEEAHALSEEIQQVEAEHRELEQVHMNLLDSRIISSRLMKEIAMAKPDAIAIRFISFTREGISIKELL
jgi:Tfp pilus assembly protein PilN